MMAVHDEEGKSRSWLRRSTISDLRRAQGGPEGTQGFVILGGWSWCNGFRLGALHHTFRVALAHKQLLLRGPRRSTAHQLLRKNGGNASRSRTFHRTGECQGGFFLLSAEIGGVWAQRTLAETAAKADRNLPASSRGTDGSAAWSQTKLKQLHVDTGTTTSMCSLLDVLDERRGV